ncbi:MAG TPA: 30S ribosomal protein S6 [Methylomirabilota bacterium]|jgi:small subunit ribosomal protein S6|nr:30S ribosomal protein S6 [Methylomirabilota bacterium]
MPSYETLCVFHPELPESRVKELAAWMQKLVENGQGSVLKVEEWGMRDLSYRIKKQRRGYFVRLEYDAEPAALKELERNLRLSEDVLRFISVVRGAPAPTAHSTAPAVTPASTPSTPAPTEAATEAP